MRSGLISDSDLRFCLAHHVDHHALVDAFAVLARVSALAHVRYVEKAATVAAEVAGEDFVVFLIDVGRW